MGRRLINIVGKRFGRLVVMHRHGSNVKPEWMCTCDCGKTTVTAGSSLRDGYTKSCGCLNIETHTKHGLSTSGHPLYAVWLNMKNRCYCPTNVSAGRYMRRGIKVCQTWRNDFNKFYMWAKRHGWQKGLSVDRKNNDGDYCPGNCRLTDHSVNNSNRGLSSRNASGYVGVWQKASGRWQARISFRKILYELGTWNSVEEALLSRNQFILKNKFPHPVQIIKELK